MAGRIRKLSALGHKPLKDPHGVLNIMNCQILRILATFPQDYLYRQCTEKIIKDRMDILKENPEREAAEKKFGVDYLEEVVHLSSLELGLVKRMQVWKPWENLVEEPPQYQWTWPPHK